MTINISYWMLQFYRLPIANSRLLSKNRTKVQTVIQFKVCFKKKRTESNNNIAFDMYVLTLKAQNKNIAADDILILYFYLSKKIRLDFSSESSTQDSLETSSLIFSEKK